VGDWASGCLGYSSHHDCNMHRVEGGSAVDTMAARVPQPALMLVLTRHKCTNSPPPCTDPSLNFSPVRRPPPWPVQMLRGSTDSGEAIGRYVL